MLQISAVCLGAIALTTSVDAADPQSVSDCETNYLKAATKIGIVTIAQQCEELVTFSKCLSQFDADASAENSLFSAENSLYKENSKACEPIWNTLDEPTLRTARNNLDMTVDNAKEINFHRHRRETISVFDMNEKINQLMADIKSLTQAADDQKTDLENKLAAKSDELDQKNAALETKLSDAVDTAKEALEDSVDDLSDKVDQSNTETAAALKQAKSDTTAALNQAESDTAAALNQAKTDAATANTALEKKISATVATKLKPFEGTEVALTSLKKSYHSNPKIPVYRVARFHTYQINFGWFDGNEHQGFGGVHPSTWTDGHGRADAMNADVKYLQRVFTQKETANKYGANICSVAFGQRTSTNGLVCGALFRIKNTGTSTIRWAPPVTMTSYHGWGETASITMNGQNHASRDCNHMCRFTPAFNIPANSQKDRISTIIFMSTSSTENNHYSRWRATLLLFRDNSLALPNGLEFVDDLDTITGSWKK